MVVCAHITCMIAITTACATSTAAPSAFFDRWADMATWPEWSADTEWVRLDGPFAAGSTGQLKPKGGPKVKFVIERLVPNQEFVDVSLLVGARLILSHVVTPRPDGVCVIEVTITMHGPLRWLWSRILGKGFKENAQPDLERLVAAAEAKG